MVAHVVLEDREPVQLGGALPGDRRLAVLRDLPRGLRGRGRRDGDRVRQAREQLPALVERHRMRADDADVVDRRARARNEAVANREQRLALDREPGVEEQVVRLCDGARDGALDREHAALGLPRLDRSDDGGEGRHGETFAVGRKELLAGRLRVRAVLPRVDDPHAGPLPKTDLSGV